MEAVTVAVLVASIVAAMQALQCSADSPATWGNGVLNHTTFRNVDEPAREECPSPLGQMPLLNGEWVPHSSPDYQGLYVQKTACPAHAGEWDCLEDGDNPELARTEYNKVFRPYACDLKRWSPHRFDRCMAGRRLIMVGDSLMNQQFNSLGCMVAEVTESGEHENWPEDGPTMGRNYSTRGSSGPEGQVLRQYLGKIELRGGGVIQLRCFSQWNMSLWDDVLADFGELTPRDVILVNFGAWYPHYNPFDVNRPWAAWKDEMNELIFERLVHSKAQVLIKSYTASHFAGGETGTWRAESSKAAENCYPALVGENWYEEWLRGVLQGCGQRCHHIWLLPLFDLTLPMHDSHHGTFGRGRAEKTADCRHFCNNVVDVWNVVLAHQICVPTGGGRAAALAARHERAAHGDKAANATQMPSVEAASGGKPGKGEEAGAGLES